MDDARERRLAFIGRLERLKGARVLLEALALLRAQVAHPLRLTVAGDGPDLASCREDAARLSAAHPNVRIDFVGWISQVACGAALVTSSDVVVMPSLWPEPFGFCWRRGGAARHPRRCLRRRRGTRVVDQGRSGAVAPAIPPAAAGLADAIQRALSLPRRAVPDVALVGSRALGLHVDRLLES